MRFDNILIVTDLDDTFLGEKGKYVDSNIEAINYFKENGGLFTAATGRDHYFVKGPMPELVDLCNAPLITSNGGAIYDTEKKTIERVLALPTLKTLDIVRKIIDFEPDISARLSLDDGYIYENEEKVYRFDIGAYRYMTKIAPFDDYLDRTWLKFTFYGEPDKINRATQYIKTLDLTGVRYINSLNENLEILHEKASKGEMLATLKEYIGRPELKISAIGDYFNDFEMITAADIPATVKNGADILKNIPGVYVTCDHKEGAIADLIKHIENNVI